ncbi:MAG: acylphosphatase, partial [Candidatus Brockarchaeota archaeon]|nr:acylphosphatase [Candidatus Brockarchaeota archaeon]
MKRKLVIEGDKVQEVGYRLFLFDIAESYGLKGFYAKNVDKNVEVLVEGEDNLVESFIKEATKSFPQYALVKNVRIEDYDGPVTSVESFYRSLSLQQLTKIVNVGLGLIDGQNKMLEKQDKMLEKQDLMLKKQDIMLEKQDTLINEVRMLREDLKSFMEERFAKIEREIALIKEKIGLK